MQRNTQDWARPSVKGVETLALRDGWTLVLSDIAPGEECAYHHVEPDDVFGIGFHLQGGARFDLGTTAFETRPLEVYASVAPRSAASSFVLPSRGFRTVSLRLSSAAARELVERHGLAATALGELAARAGEAVATRRLAALDAAGAATVNAMFASPHNGTARALHLESCALALLAGQVGAAGSGGAALRPDQASRMRTARAHLDADLDDPPGIVRLARLCATNEFSLKRDFKQAYGTTIFGYVRQRRLERAAGDLHAGLPVAAAAGQAGYACPRCFADAFRRHFGILPGEVTRARLAAIPATRG